MINVKSFELNFRSSIYAIVILFSAHIYPAQSELKERLQGTWELQQVISSKRKKNLTLNIKYSENYNRYFGNLTSYGDRTTLYNISFDDESKTLKFSSHISKESLFILTVSEGKIEGTVSENGLDHHISGSKTESSNSSIIKEYGTYERTKLPNNIKELYQEAGNLSSDTVLLIVQGGPFEEMQYGVDQFEKWADDLHIVFVKQAQIINPTILPPENNLTLEDAYYENLISVEMLHKTIQNFKEQNKKVLVWGVSYGAWVIQKYIVEYGIGADAVSIAAGRLDLEEEIWKEGKMNQKVFDITYKKDQRIYTELNFSFTKPSSYLLVEINKERFTKSLKQKDLSKLVVYQYGKKDGTVGRLSKSEIEFLKSKNVEIEVCKRCYHRQMLSEKIMNSAIRKMLDFVDKE